MADTVKDYPPYLDYPKPKKKQTNADRIRAMTDEELAKFIPSGPCPPSRWHRDGFGARYTECPNEERFHGCRDCWLDWLRQEVSENG